jgi:hypothetical protein
MIDRIDAILPKFKASGAADYDIINAMIAVYCSIALSSTTPPAERAAMLGTFSGLVYDQIKSDAKPN